MTVGISVLSIGNLIKHFKASIQASVQYGIIGLENQVSTPIQNIKEMQNQLKEHSKIRFHIVE